MIPIRDRGQGWQWKSTDILIVVSSSFHRALTSQLPECGWSKAEESSSFCFAWTSQLAEWLEQVLASFVGEACCFWRQTLRGSGGAVLNCFPGVLITGNCCLLDSGVVDPRDDAYNFNSSRDCQDDCVRACPNWLKCVLFFYSFLIFNSYLISWLKGINPIAQWNGCPF